MRPSTSERMRTEPRNRIAIGMPMISIARPADSDSAGDHPGEVEDARRQREHRVEQRAVGARIRGDAEELAEQRFARCRPGLAQRGLHAHFGVAVDVGHFVRRAVTAGDRRRSRRPRACRGFRRAPSAGIPRRRTARPARARDRTRRAPRATGRGIRGSNAEGGRVGVGRVHGRSPSRTESTEVRVARQAAVHSESAVRPVGVIA